MRRGPSNTFQYYLCMCRWRPFVRVCVCSVLNEESAHCNLHPVGKSLVLLSPGPRSGPLHVLLAAGRSCGRTSTNTHTQTHGVHTVDEIYWRRICLEYNLYGCRRVRKKKHLFAMATLVESFYYNLYARRSTPERIREWTGWGRGTERCGEVSTE